VDQETAHGTVVRADHVRFSVFDEDLALESVRLHQEVARPRNGPEFVRFAGSSRWELCFPLPAAHRMEYKLELTHNGGGTELICDPFNPLRAPGPFGDRSVLEFPGYAPPGWLGNPPRTEGTIARSEIKSRVLRRHLPVIVWTSPGGSDEDPLPVLVVHDGPEYAEYASLIRYLEAMVAQGRVPAMRAALLAPVERDETYSASATYARALTHEIIPALDRLAPLGHGRRMRVGMGASLGALAMLHAHRKKPASFGGLFLQSGSYFRQRFDPQEAGFFRFRRISRFIGQVLAAETAVHPVRVTLTCGAAEENLANNRALAAALRRQGYHSELHENPDAHNWVAWRDSFDPHLGDLLTELWA